ncbi:uncharacterized protein LOC142518485 [Primulina tabacum]|uniref:uncharacterized protein LOC142518485 n=1 Tax=Primulina tabacum TaxID=48773 RepID=UPI003F5A0268
MRHILKEDYLDFVLVPTGLLIMLGFHVWQIEAKERGQAVAVIGASVSAATCLASISLALSSVIRTWFGSSNRNDLTVRSFIHANFLISIPNCQVPVAAVETAVTKASNFWVVGLRSLYFATNLLPWTYGRTILLQ